MRIIRLMLCLVALTLFAGCASYKVYYDIGLTGVERPAIAQEQYGEQTITTAKDKGDTKYVYEDDMVKIDWQPTAQALRFVLENKTSQSIRVIWDEAVYVDVYGRCNRVMHSGVKYTERNSSQPSSVVVRNCKLDDFVFPTDNVYFSTSGSTGWQEAPLLPTYGEDLKYMKRILEPYKGKTFQLLLPLQIGDTVNEYIFIFIINKIEIRERA